MLNKFFKSIQDLSEDAKAKKVMEEFSFHPDYDRIYHYHVRRTGGTSINMSFLQLNGREPARTLFDQLADRKKHRLIVHNKVYVAWNKKLIEEGNYFFGFSHIPAHDLELPENTFTLTCLRDPVNRLLSHYLSLKYYLQKDENHPVLEIEGKWLGRSFSDFLDQLPKRNLLRQLYMFSKSYDLQEAADRIKSLNFFTYTVELEEDIRALSRQLNLELESFHERNYNYRERVQESDINRLRELLEPEYQLLTLLKE
ncbi:MAG: sulfotransferase family 2 domain-containing protein [Bacteroidota bacterium]